MGSFVSNVLNLLATKYLLPATSYLVLFCYGAAVTLVALVMLCFIKEELDVENLRKRDAIVAES